ncbi:MAG: hypothetical protein KatS3mg008_1403 [Acidimicrobiales bacterium]|nr:MAG: hypothetical protein KatS3mg008_1403 [Acidimicrobiales bacterium]
MIRGRRLVRRIAKSAVAVFLAALTVMVLRLRGSGGPPPSRGGWRELTDSDFGSSG